MIIHADGRAGSSRLGFTGGGDSLLPDYHLAESLRGEEAWNVGDRQRRTESLWWHFGEKTPQALHARFSQHSALFKFGLGERAAGRSRSYRSES